MIRTEFMCKQYRDPRLCPGYRQGRCMSCYSSDSVMVLVCDRCGVELFPDEPLEGGMGEASPLPGVGYAHGEANATSDASPILKMLCERCKAAERR